MVNYKSSGKQSCERYASGHIETPNLIMEWTEAPWDTVVFSFPVLQINKFEIFGSLAVEDFRTFEVARDSIEAGLVSCRLSHSCIQQSILLEDRGFRFIEMLYQPELLNLKDQNEFEDTGLCVSEAKREDVSGAMEIAGSVFHNERFHVDPRLNHTLGNQRYRNWVQNCIDHPTQKLYLIRDGEALVAFFITEMLPDQTCYWHLTAVASHAQGRGYGKRAWLSMLNLARNNNANRVQTCIVARNNRVLNLYARLGFRFPPPLMTFHWVKK